MGALPNVASFNHDRVAGLTNGPYELSAMICMIGVLLLWKRSFPFMGASFAGLIWTQSRISLAAFLVFNAISALRGRVGFGLLSFAVTSVFITVVYSMRDVSGLDTSQMMLELSAVWESYGIAAGQRNDYFDLAYSNSANAVIMSGAGDPSMLLRAARWSIVFTTAGESFSNLFLGMGPSFYSVALDSYYVRLIGETGIIGLLTFVLVGLRLKDSVLYRDHRIIMQGLLVQLAIIGMFIDIFASLKVMCLFWMMVGALQREDQEIRN